jgi:hypothetical protein
MKQEQRTRFNAAKLLQSDLNAWLNCQHALCREKQSCLGGPRGTCARTLGWPACTQEGKQRLREAKVQWRRSETYEQESEDDRALRRLEEEMRDFDIMLKTQGI